jgi:hypothetical protein
MDPRRDAVRRVLATPEEAGMTTFEVVTTYAPRHWESHARRCVESFHKHWEGIPLSVYTDADLEAQSTWLSQFKRRHASLPTHNYRFDAVRFAHKVAAIELAFAKCRSDYLIWMDADCVTHADVDAEWLEGLSQRADFAYLRRAKKYPECGFMMIAKNGDCEQFVANLVSVYTSDRLFEFKEWHDSWAIEEVRWEMSSFCEIVCASLSGDAENTAHPLVNGPLGARLDHCKGNRKQAGRSHASDLKVKRTEAHWNG